MCWGIDRLGGPNIFGFDLDDVEAGSLPDFVGVELVICGEVLEHLSNPGHFLKRLKKAYPVTTIFTVPNAFTDIGRNSLKTGIEQVNSDHTCYYSYTTLKELLDRHAYQIDEFYWYNGRPLFAEGLIFVCH